MEDRYATVSLTSLELQKSCKALLPAIVYPIPDKSVAGRLKKRSCTGLDRVIGTIIMAIGITLVQTGHTVGEPIVAVGSITILLDALFFGWLVFQGERNQS